MKNNPFTSDIFTSIWSKHFNNSDPGISFNFFAKLLFVRHKIPNFYVNCGKTHTKGINYSVEDSKIQDLKGKVLLIYDVPTYFNINTELKLGHLTFYKIKQYPGFLIELEKYSDLNDYMSSTFSKSSRYKLKKYRKKLELCFNIRYRMFHGQIRKEEYDFVFNRFHELLNKRFTDKQIINNNLDPKEWGFYNEVVYPMIQDKKASLFVIYDGKEPIGVTLNYFSDDIMFDAITVFDIDYSKFHLGSVTIMKLIEWCLENNMKIMDFSKGYFDYKTRWANKIYDFEYHVIFDSSSLYGPLLAKIISKYFRFKQFLRDRHINEKLHKATFWLKNSNHKDLKEATYTFSETEQNYGKDELVEVDLYKTGPGTLKKIIFEFLYLNNESSNDLKIFKLVKDNSGYIFQGKTNRLLVQIQS